MKDLIINEFTRGQLINKSKSSKMGRFRRRMQVGLDEVDIGRVGMLELTASSLHLDVYFIVRDYRVSVRFVDFMVRLRNLLHRSKYRNDIRKCITIALNQSINRDEVLINCTCPDFYYRFSYTATVKGFGFNTNQYIPATIRNPKNQGSGCKHILRVLNAPSHWKERVITAIRRSVEYDPTIVGFEKGRW